MDPEESVELQDLSQMMEWLSTEDKPGTEDARGWMKRCMMAEAALERTRELQRKIEQELDADLESVENLSTSSEEGLKQESNKYRVESNVAHPIELLSSVGVHAPGCILLGPHGVRIAHILCSMNPQELVGLRKLGGMDPTSSDDQQSASMVAPPPQCVARNAVGSVEEEEEFDSVIAHSPKKEQEEGWADAEEERHSWEILWKGGGGMGALHRLKFESSRRVSDTLHLHIANWHSSGWDHLSRLSAGQRESDLLAISLRQQENEQFKSGSSLAELDSIYENLKEEKNKDSQRKNKDKKLYSRRTVSRMLGAVYAKMLIRRQEKMIKRKMESKSKSFRKNVSIAESKGKDSSVTGNPGTSSKPKSITLRPGKHLPGLSGESAMLSETHIRALAAQFPTRFRLTNWNLLYSSLKHGISLQTLYRKTLGKHPSVLVMKDDAGYMFGCFVTEEWRPSSKYFGTGESFVFQLEPSMKAFAWSQKNNYFLFCTHESLAVGGGGHFAIWVDNDFCWGHSGDCETFDSPCLASKEEFRCVHVEVWGIS